MDCDDVVARCVAGREEKEERLDEASDVYWYRRGFLQSNMSAKRCKSCDEILISTSRHLQI
jgi:hypothetical protein